MRRLLIVMGVLILAAALTVHFGSGMVAEKAVKHYLIDKQISVRRLDMGHASMRSAYVREAVLGTNDALTLSGVAVKYVYRDEKLSVQSVQAERVKATLSVHEGTWDMGGLETLLKLPVLSEKDRSKAVEIQIDAPMQASMQGENITLKVEGGHVQITQAGNTMKAERLRLQISPDTAKPGNYQWQVQTPKLQLLQKQEPLSEMMQLALAGTASPRLVEGQGTLSDVGKTLPIIVRTKHNVKTGATRLQWTSNAWSMTDSGKGFAVYSPLLSAVPPMNARLRIEGEALLRPQKDPSISHRFVIEEAELAPLLKLVFADDIAFTGKVEGTIPLKWNGEKAPQIVKAELKNREPGTLIYDPLTGASAALQGEEQASILLEALRKFNYNSLDITANSDAAGVLKATFRIIGANPELYAGKTVDFSLTVNGDVLSIIESQSRVKDAINTTNK